MVLPNLSALRLEPTGPPESQQRRLDPDQVVPYNPTVDLPEDLQENVLMEAVQAAEEEFMGFPTIADDPDRCGLTFPTLKKGVAMLGDEGPSDIKDHVPTVTRETFVPSDTAISICLVSPRTARSAAPSWSGSCATGSTRTTRRSTPGGTKRRCPTPAPTTSRGS